MKPQRYDKLTNDNTERLTHGEIAMGWHFCPEWDSLLIGPGWEEMEHCLCPDVPLKQAFQPDEDGFYMMDTGQGRMSALTLRQIANTLDELNKDWTKEKAEELARRKNEPIEGGI